LKEAMISFKEAYFPKEIFSTPYFSIFNIARPYPLSGKNKENGAAQDL